MSNFVKLFSIFFIFYVEIEHSKGENSFFLLELKFAYHFPHRMQIFIVNHPLKAFKKLSLRLKKENQGNFFILYTVSIY